MSWTEKEDKSIKVGDMVAYSKPFLRSISCLTGDLPFARGKVTALIPLGTEVTLAEIDWGNPDIPNRVNVKNLVEVSRIAFEL